MTEEHEETAFQVFTKDISSSWDSAYRDFEPIKWNKKHTKVVWVAGFLLGIWIMSIGTGL